MIMHPLLFSLGQARAQIWETHTSLHFSPIEVTESLKAPHRFWRLPAPADETQDTMPVRVLALRGALLHRNVFLLHLRMPCILKYANNSFKQKQII